jgi:hypothetical protein
MLSAPQLYWTHKVVLCTRVSSVSVTRGTAMGFGLTNFSQSRVNEGVAYVAFTQAPVLAEVRDGENMLGPGVDIVLVGWFR